MRDILTFILSILSAACIIVILMVFTEPKENPIRDIEKDFCGGIIMQKDEKIPPTSDTSYGYSNDGLLSIKKNNKVELVRVYQLQYKKYQLGDTIKCNN